MVHQFEALWRGHAKGERCVAGLDFGPDGLHGVVLIGATKAPRAVLAAKHLDVPAAWLSSGELANADALADELRAWLTQTHGAVDALYVALPEAQVVRQWVSLPGRLLQEDIRFQLQAEMSALFPELGPEACLAHRCTFEGREVMDVLMHDVAAVSQAAVQSLRALADRVGVRLAGLVPRDQVLAADLGRHPAEATPSLAVVPASQVAYALVCRMWHGKTASQSLLNLLPDQPRLHRVRWHRGVCGLALGSVLGLMMLGVWRDDLGRVIGGWVSDAPGRAAGEGVSGMALSGASGAVEGRGELPPSDITSAALPSPLQHVPLTRLRYVGSLAREVDVQALVQVVDDAAASAQADVTVPVYRVAVGDGLGQDAGRVRHIAPDALHIRQWVRGDAGGWRSEEVTLPLQDGGVR